MIHLYIDWLTKEHDQPESGQENRTECYFHFNLPDIKLPASSQQQGCSDVPLYDEGSLVAVNIL